MCVRNAEKRVKQILNCIAEQDFPHESMEIVIVDDGSEDKTLHVIKNATKKMDIDARVFHQEWRGVGPARNVIVDHAKGKYVLMVDSDQSISIDYVRKHVTYMEKNKEVGICYGILRIPSSGSSALILDLIRVIILRNEKGRLGVAGGGSTYRVKAMRQVGGYDNHLNRTGEDIDISYRIQKAGWSVSLAGGKIQEKYDMRYSWRNLWNRYYRHGLNGQYIYRYKRRARELIRMTPLAGLVFGLIKMHVAFKLVHRTIVVLLPVFYSIQRAAWCTGFIHSQFKLSNYSRAD